MVTKKKRVSALVLVRASSGVSLDETGPLRSENLAQHAPDRDAAAAAASLLSGAGLAMEPLAGIAFSVAGPVSGFERLLQVRLAEGRRGELSFVLPDGRVLSELRGADLPEELRGLLEAVAFERPPDFGPTGVP